MHAECDLQLKIIFEQLLCSHVAIKIEAFTLEVHLLKSKDVKMSLQTVQHTSILTAFIFAHLI